MLADTYKFSVLLFCIATVLSQGTVWFANRQPEGSDSYQYTFADGTGVGTGYIGTGVGTGYTAQLFGGRSGTPVENLQPLFPTTTFNPRAPGYVIPVIVTLPGVLPGEMATVLTRVYNGSNWEESICRTEELNRIGILGEGNLGGALGGFGAVVTCIPEPGTIAVLLFGSAAILFLRRYS